MDSACERVNGTLWTVVLMAGNIKKRSIKTISSFMNPYSSTAAAGLSTSAANIGTKKRGLKLRD